MRDQVVCRGSLRDSGDGGRVFRTEIGTSEAAGREPERAGRDRPHGATDPGTKLPADHGARRAQGHPAAALRGQGALRRAECCGRADRRHGLRHAQRLRRPDPHADRRSAGEPGAAVQPVPHHGRVLADADGPAQWPQPPHEQHGRDHRDRHGVPRQHGATAEQRGAAGGDAPAERLQHRLLRQEPRDGALGGQRLRPDRPLADPVRIRRVLRLLRRRDEPAGRRTSTTA